MDFQEVFDRVSSLTELATFASSLSGILAVTRDPTAAPKHLAEAISRDPALSMKILRTVNSCFFSLNRKIETMEDAVVALGFAEVERMAMAVSVISRFAARTTRGSNLQQLWQHSLVAAVAAQAIVESFRFKNAAPGDVYLAALLHDIGKAVTLQFLPEAAESIIELMDTQGLTALEAEQDVLDGATHTQIGSWVSGNWGLPLHTVQGIQMHHSPLETPADDELPRIIWIADSLCYQIGVPALKTEAATPPALLEASKFLEENENFQKKFRALWESKSKMIESMAKAM